MSQRGSAVLHQVFNFHKAIREKSPARLMMSMKFMGCASWMTTTADQKQVFLWGLLYVIT